MRVGGGRRAAMPDFSGSAGSRHLSFLNNQAPDSEEVKATRIFKILSDRNPSCQAYILHDKTFLEIENFLAATT
jgi:hypothetical protein